MLSEVLIAIFVSRKFDEDVDDNDGMSDVYEPVDYGNHTFFGCVRTLMIVLIDDPEREASIDG